MSPPHIQDRNFVRPAPDNPWPRATAARAIYDVLDGRSLDDVFARVEAKDQRDLALAKNLAYGVLRELRLLDALAQKLFSRPVNNGSWGEILVWLGIYQLRATRVPPHAAVSETVEASRWVGAPELASVVNACLRRYIKEADELEDYLDTVSPAVQASYPDWLADTVVADWGDQAGAVLNAGNQQAPMTLRVNRRKVTVDEVLERWQGQDIGVEPVGPDTPDAVRLDHASAVEALPGFASGWASVQDASAQHAADLLDLAPGLKVLDACAAPGGKTAHMLEREKTLDVTALDISGQRLIRVEENLRRLKVSARIVKGNAAESTDWWDGTPFDRILIDAPCSGTGVIRRHPDIKWLRRAEDIPAMAARQAQMLQNLWPCLKPGGLLVYATCSILRAEGVDVIEAFLKATPDAGAVPIEATWGSAEVVGRRIAPGGDFDGFYYAVLEKRAE